MMEGYQEVNEIDLIDLMFYCLKRWRVIVICMILFAAFAGVYRDSITKTVCRKKQHIYIVMFFRMKILICCKPAVIDKFNLLADTMAYTHLDPGRELEISAHIYFSPPQMDISELVKLSPEQLKAQEEVSVEQEKAIYEKFSEIEKEWAKQAMVTISLRKAQEYLKIPPVAHTSNQWTVDQYGRHEMSNMVYCFSWREYERTEWSRAEQKSIPIAWELSWSLHFNTTQNPDYSGSGWQLAGQERKVFKDRAAMEKYLQGRIAAYSHLFTEISPPIPEDARKRFCVNGILLPGYTVETPVPDLPDEKNVEDLLSLLEDGDMDALPQPEEPAPPPAPPPRRPAPKKTRPQRASPVR